MKNNGNTPNNQHNDDPAYERVVTFSKEELARQQAVFGELYNNMQSLLTESPYAEMESVRGVNSDFGANTVAVTDAEKAEQVLSYEKSAYVFSPESHVLYRVIEHEGPDGPAYIDIENVMPSVSRMYIKTPRKERVRIVKDDNYSVKRQVVYATGVESKVLTAGDALNIGVQFIDVHFVSKEEYEARLKKLAAENTPQKVASVGLVKLLKRKLEKHK